MINELAKHYLQPLAIMGGLLVFQVALLAVYYWRLPPEVPLFYSLPVGVNQLASTKWVLFMPGSTLFIGALHALMYRLGLERSMPIVRLLVLWSGSFYAMLMTIILAHLLWLVY